jgi:hypothetical protein
MAAEKRFPLKPAPKKVEFAFGKRFSTACML